MAKERVFLRKLLGTLISINLFTILWPLVAASAQGDGIADGSLLFFGSMLVAAPMLIAENW